MYCGRKLQIKGKCTYGKGRCPSCRHIIFIPRRDRIDEFLPREAIKEDKADWSKLSDEQIGNIMEFDARSKPDLKDPEVRRNMWKPDVAAFRTLLPSYDEITLFTLSFAIIVLYLMSGKFREDIYKAITTAGNGHIIAYGLVAAAGMFLSFVNIFLRIEKYDSEKYLMLFFAVVVTAGTGIYSGYIILGESKGWLLIFPIWNIINGVILLFLLRLGALDTECIVENGFDFLQVLASVASVGVILGLCNYVFKMHWVISYSICVCYTITINDAIHSVLGINKNPTKTIDKSIG
jgi:hypothetical protein